MAERRRTLRLGLTIILALSLLVCPLSVSGQLVYTPAQAQGHAGQIDFTPHVGTLVVTGAPETPSIDVLGTPVVFATPTLGPGQVFDADTRPVTSTSFGDDKFGWGDIPGYPDLVLVWATDENGTDYRVMSRGDEDFAGHLIMDDKGAVVDILNDGYEDMIRERDEKLSDLTKSQGWGAGASLVTILTGVFLFLCPATWGAGCVGAFVTGAVALGEAVRENIIMDGLRPEIEQLEQNLHGRLSSYEPNDTP